MSKAKTLLKLSALSLAVGLYGCTGSDSGGDTTLTCTAPEVLNSAGTACVADESLIEARADQAVIYYKREDGVYSDWGLHLWDDAGTDNLAEGVGTDWANPMMPTGTHPLYGAYWVIDLNSETWEAFKFIVRDLDGAKDIGGADLTFSNALYGNDVFLFQGVAELFADALTEIPVVLSGASAHFISYSELDEGAHIVYDSRSPLNTVELWYSGTGSLAFDTETLTVSGGEIIELSVEAMTEAQKEAYPHLATLSGYYLENESIEGVKDLLTGQLWIVESKADTNEIIKLTRVQTAPVIDNLFYDAAKDVELGAIVDGANTTFNLWAPTAQAVSVNLYDDEKTLLSTHELTKNYDSGVWSVEDVNAPHGTYYRYDMEVFHYVTEDVESYEVTDPYSLSLSTNSQYSQVVDFNDASFAVTGTGWTWGDIGYNMPESPEDLMIYETHVRDLSIWDTNKTNPEHDGTYLALTDFTRESMTHLNALKAAGLQGIQFLPVFDIATIDEDAANRVDVFDDIADYCAISTAAAAKAAELEVDCESGQTIEQVLASFDASSSDAQDFYQYLRPKDSFNWGYDPFHYTVPEGSYSTNPEGTTRITEFRQMVGELKHQDFTVIMDVVYNHTNASGLNEKSVLDKVVPGYYHRRDTKSGVVIQDSCCPDTATEHKMMAKLMTDSLVTWARDYKIDGFRFDLMGLQTKAAMEAALVAVKEVNPDAYFYGEGWNYGAAGDNKRGENGSQANMAGTGIGTFTDRLRDAVRGGGPFDNMDGAEKSLRRNQGLSTSAVPNELNLVGSPDPDADEVATDNGLTPDEELAANILKNADMVRLGLAANLKSFAFTASNDNLTTGAQLMYGDSAAGYAEDPQEIINYVSKHDNQTLWDIIAYKADDNVSSVDRAKMQSIAVATSAFAQGIPFFHMGVDLLRSKSMERDSYDSGDWYNKVDFADGAASQWNVGLPREDKDGSNWDFIKEVTANDNAEPSETDIAWMRESFVDILTMRSGSPLFRLTTGDEVKNRVAFHNTGSEQVAGVIAMSIDDGVNAGEDLDPTVDALLVMFNYTDEAQTLTVPAAEGLTFAVRGETNGESASVTGNEFTVPALSYAVFEIAQGAEQGAGVPAGDAPTFGSSTIYAVGDFSGWKHVYDGYYAGENVYKFAMEFKEADTFAFRFADSGWGNSTNADSFTDGAESAFTLTASGDNDNNFSVTVLEAEIGEYLITLDLSEDIPEVTFTAQDFSLANDIYVRGSITDAAWAPVAAGLFEYDGAGQYSVWIDATAGSYAFKVADSAWTAGTNFGAGSVNTVTIGEALPMDGSGDINITIPTDGYYQFVVDTMKSKATPELTVKADTPTLGDMFVRGDMNGWGETDQLTYDGLGMYSATITLAAQSYRFKFANSGWGTQVGFSQATIDDTSITMTAGDDNGLVVDIAAAGDYVFSLDANTSTVSVVAAP